ncbi:ABC transporter substrate-binding protein [Arthrobacter sp. ERGS1:01]|uniref:metal ABC transporter solute-binding protein, Zn/Mn family n=1 Tax=Arthrobacter sp. ERGS1:01 TaxID=1704044 RepID=UPI0006B562FC|nr:zinc ABC transporter substrate-binding protein [Arthrobacter sp. ERGS1:01]ALE06604.1 ABC transporter substrate-binding protein [Arthrobacter sp. ERGS1:01]
MRLRRPHRSALIVALAASASLLLGACGGGASAGGGNDGKISVVASTNVYGSIISAIGGDKVSVYSIIDRPDADPHSYEATPQDKLAMSKAAFGVENGGGYDDFFGQLASGVLADDKIVNVASLSGMDTGAADFNEHLWYSFPVMDTLADQLVARLSAADPAGAAAFKDNAATFKKQLGALEGQLATVKKSYDGTPAAITEPVPLYMLTAAGLVNKTPEAYSKAVEDGNDVPAAVLLKTTALFSSHEVKLLAYNTQTEGPQTKAVLDAAQGAGIPVLDVSETLPANTSYLQWMTANVGNLLKALAG